ncbi:MULTISPECIES: PAS domain S-box protein [Methanoculleus]|jgi:PAS domain S-box-containing protein|uniref:histidine kinase n=2 Tax=Methanoculleus thermophilus TaxID=2200 RepID=A0A1G8WZV9_9EURY|nr:MULTISPECIES: PAS domain S-box protein [Methanoculleus]SDJ83751.1 PAS domain S-box-containing protein [Methanoculleus thermophilus]
MQTTEPNMEVRPEVLQILEAIEDGIILADSRMKIRTITPSMERLAGISADGVRGADAAHIVANRILPDTGQRGPVLALLSTRTGSGEVTVQAGERWYAVSSRQVPETGDWIIRFRDVTRQTIAEEEVRRISADQALLSRAATELAGMPPEADVFSAIGAHLHELAPGSIVVVSAADIQAGTLSPRAFFGIEPFLPEIIEVFGENLTGITVEIPPYIREIMISGEIEEVKGGLQEIIPERIFQEACRKFEAIAGFGPIYCIPFTWKGEIFGTAVILTRLEEGEINLRAVEVLRNLASIALQRHRAEAELRASEKTFRTLIEKGSEFILIIDEQLTIRFASPPIEQIDGFPPEALVGRHAFDMIQPEDLPLVEEVVSTLTGRPGGSMQVEVRFRGPRGTHVIEAIVTNLLGDPHIRGFVVNAWDITERKRTEDALRRAEREKALVLDSTVEMFTYYDRDLNVIWVNRAAAAFIGREPADLVGYRCYEIWHNRTSVCDICPVVIARETGQPQEAEITAPNGRVFFLRGYPVIDEAGELIGLIEFAQDITERKRIEEERARLHHDLVVANREANLYLDILTHDIKNTENVSNLYAELLADVLDGEAGRYAENLRRSIKKSIEILGTVSTIRRIHQASRELKPLDLDAAVSRVIENFPGSAIHYNAVRCQVWADDLLSVIFDNLIGNAVKFGGPDVEIAVKAEEQNDKVLVTVEDTGPGVPDAEKSEIFRRYEKKKRGVGEGLGLYLVQILVERYGGSVWVEDRVAGHPEKGAAFRFTLKKVDE